MIGSHIRIRPLAAEELHLLTAVTWSSGLPEKHRDRLERQSAGDVTYLIGWNGADPIGHMLVRWTGPNDEPMRSQLTDCAEIEDFTVVSELRSQGIGRLMMGFAEDEARQRGLRRIGVGVTLDNLRAKALYKRQGFSGSGFGTYITRWQYADAAGEKRWREASCIYLVKEIHEETNG